MKSIPVALALVGVLVLGGDILGDLAYFSLPERKTGPLLTAALVRNLLTLVAVVALFARKRWAGYALVIAALVGLWRRAVLLLPLAGSPGTESEWMLVTSGMDTAFRFLLLGFAAGYLAAGKYTEDEETR